MITISELTLRNCRTSFNVQYVSIPSMIATLQDVDMYTAEFAYNNLLPDIIDVPFAISNSRISNKMSSKIITSTH